MDSPTAARSFARIALGLLLLSPASVSLAQQYGGGVVLDPVQPGNIQRIRQREIEYFDNLYRSSNVQPQAEPTPPPVPPTPPTYDQQAKQAFKGASYAQAANYWQHALVDEPQNGLLAMLLGQAEFAPGSYNEAAGAVQMAMTMLPHQQWGLVVKNYDAIYPRDSSYANQLRALEKASKDKPDDPALRFLLGYHYLYLGYPKHAEKQLQKALELAPQDRFAERLLAVATGEPVAALERTSPPGAQPATARPTTAPSRPVKSPAAAQ